MWPGQYFPKHPCDLKTNILDKEGPGALDPLLNPSLAINTLFLINNDLVSFRRQGVFSLFVVVCIGKNIHLSQFLNTKRVCFWSYTKMSI